MFNGAVDGFDGSDFYARFRTDYPNKLAAGPPGLISDFIYEPGVVITPAKNVTQQVIDDLERIKSAQSYVAQAYESFEQETVLAEKRLSRLLSSVCGNRTQALLVLAAVLSIMAGLYLFVIGWHSNQITRVQAANLAKRVAAGGSSDSGSVPTAAKPNPAAVAGYQVAPNLPKYIDIPKINVHARVLSLGITKSGALAAPDNIYDAGWYDQSSQPGQNGAMIIDGHISNWQAEGIFYGLNKLQAGDTITITRGDNKTFTYKVVKSQLLNAGQVDMSSLLVSQNTNLPGLNLISCSGEVIPGTNEFNKRLIVYTVQM